MRMSDHRKCKTRSRETCSRFHAWQNFDNHFVDTFQSTEHRHSSGKF